MPITALKLEGRLDTAAVGQMESAIAARAGAVTAPTGKAIIDLQDLTFLSSMEIRLLASTSKQFKQRGITFVTVPPSDGTVPELLQLASLTDHLNLVENASAAEAALVGNS